MARSLESEFTDELSNATLYPRLFVKLEIDSGDVLVWSGVGDFTYSGDVYTGVGDLGQVDVIRESGELEVPEVQLTLNGIPTSTRDIADTENYQYENAFIYLGLFDSDGLTVTSANQIQNFFTGTISNMAMAVGAQFSSIGVRLKSWFAVLDRTYKREFTQGDWLKDHTDDQFFSFVARLAERDTVWQET